MGGRMWEANRAVALPHPVVARAVHHVSGALLPLITTAVISGPVLISPTVSPSCSFVPSPCLHFSPKLDEISLPI